MGFDVVKSREYRVRQVHLRDASDVGNKQTRNRERGKTADDNRNGNIWKEGSVSCRCVCRNASNIRFGRLYLIRFRDLVTASNLTKHEPKNWIKERESFYIRYINIYLPLLFLFFSNTKAVESLLSADDCRSQRAIAGAPYTRQTDTWKKNTVTKEKEREKIIQIESRLPVV